MTVDLIERLTAAMAETERTAWHYHEWSWTADVNGCSAIINQYEEGCDCGYPKRILDKVAADRELIDLITSERHHVSEDCWYTCAAATEEREGETTCRDDAGSECDCGRDFRVQKRLETIAKGYGIYTSGAAQISAIVEQEGLPYR